jgi:hypothetical protein
MLIAGSATLMGATPATYVGSQSKSPNGSLSVTYSLSAYSVGDLAVLIDQNQSNATTMTSSGWTLSSTYTWPTFGYVTKVWFKRLGAGDIAGGVSFSGAGASDCSALYVVRGATTATVLATDQSSAHSVVTTHTTPANASMGVVFMIFDRDPASGPFTFPAGYSVRFAGASGTDFVEGLADMLTGDEYPGSVTIGGFSGLFAAIVLTIDLT